MMNFKNAKYIDPEHSRIDFELDHPLHGWIPMTLNPVEYPEVWAEVVATGPEPYTAPIVDETRKLAEWRANAKCSPLQGKLALGEPRWLAVEQLINDPETPWTMKQIIQDASVWERNSETMDTLIWLMGMTPEEADELFKIAMEIKV